MPESLGVRLRQQRERQQIALVTIAEQTKIKLSLLEELERDDVSHWPSGIFRRAFIRAYAHAIGLDQDVIVREFLEIHPEPPEVVETDLAHALGVDRVDTRAAPPMRLRYLVASAIDSIARRRRGAVEKPPSAAQEDIAPAVPAVATAPAPEAPAPEAPAPEAPTPEAPAPEAPALEPPPPPAPAARWPPEPTDLTRLARLCTDLARLNDPGETAPLLQELADVLDAVGVIVWSWDPEAAELLPALAHGYSDRVLAQLPRVSGDADNATAAAFRSAQPCVVRGSDKANGALATPIVAPSGCVGVLAVEVKQGSEELPRVRALAAVLAAQLSRFVDARSTSGAAGTDHPRYAGAAPAGN